MPGRIVLYVVPASHPCAAVEYALNAKGLDYKRVDLPPLMHVVHQRVRFGTRTVPSVRFADGRKLLGSRAILRELDRMAPEPPLLPADPELRAKVEAAEAWGDEVLQPMGRRIVWPVMARSTDAMMSYTEDANLPVPDFMARLSAGAIVFGERRLNKATEEAWRADLRALPGHLDRIDAWIAEGVMGGEQPNVADLQIASTLRLLLTIEDVAPLIDGRPAGELARRLWPHYPGRAPRGTLPVGDLVPATA